MTEASVPPPKPAFHPDAAPNLAAHLLPAHHALRRSRGRWRVVAFIALALAIIAVVGRFALSEQGPGNHIARVVVDGMITTDPARLRVFEELAEDDSVKAVIVSINSPGGTTAGGEELYEAVSALRAKKPVVAVINELGASAAYMTAIASDRIYARRLSLVGSIGVLYQHVNAQKLFETIGVDLEKVASGPLKAEPDYDEPMSPAVIASRDALVMDSFDWFVDVVAERRGLTRPQTLALADGRVINGRQALAAKLIDDVGGEAEAAAWLEAEHAIAPDTPIRRAYPFEEDGLNLLRLVTGEMRETLGLGSGPIVLDGLVSLWQGENAL